MKAEGIFGKTGQKLFPGLGMAAIFILLSVMFYFCKVAAMDIPPEVEKKAVQLNKIHADAERSFAANCGKCHKAPDPAKPGSIKQSCSNSTSRDELVILQGYMSDVHAGKDLYETYCDRCHSLIDPGSHTFDYWSKNICTSDSCMVKRKLNSDEEQQLLLYLSSHARKK